MKNVQLTDFDSEDIEDFLVEVEASFGIQFVQNELLHVKTFGQLSDHITGKIKRTNVQDCTGQQAFYKLRNAISRTRGIDRSTIRPNLDLNNVFPRASRRQEINAIEKELGFKLSILRPRKWITAMLALLLVICFLALFLYWKIALLGIVLTLFGSWLATKFGKELEVGNLKQLTQKVTREHYLRCRRNTDSFNKLEIEKILIDWFADYFGLECDKLIREQRLP